MKSRRNTQRRRRDTRRRRTNRKNTRARRGGFSPLNEAFQSQALSTSIGNIQNTLGSVSKTLSNMKGIDPAFKNTTQKQFGSFNNNMKQLDTFNKRFLDNSTTGLNMKAIPMVKPLPMPPSTRPPTVMPPPTTLPQPPKVPVDMPVNIQPYPLPPKVPVDMPVYKQPYFEQALADLQRTINPTDTAYAQAKADLYANRT